MSPEPRVWRDKISESGTWYNRARVVDRDGNVQVISDFSGTITLKVFDLNSDDADTAVYSNTALVLATTLTNTLQTWDVDSTGWNFEYGLTSNVFTREGGHTYRACYFLTHTEEGVRTLQFELLVEPALGA